MISKEYPCAFQPFQLLTLWNMLNQIEPNFFLDVINGWGKVEKDFSEIYQSDNSATISQNDCVRLEDLLHVTDNLFDMVNLKSFNDDEPVFYTAKVRIRLNGRSNDGFNKTYLGFYNNIKNVRESIRRFFEKQCFLYLPLNHADYYNQEDPFGIADKFPEANKEIAAAGNCYATGNYTACVFHLMRAVEYGLRVIAKGLKVPFPKTYETKNWGTLIDNIEMGIKAIEKKKRTPKRDRDLLFYNMAATEFKFIKNAWRNEVMHTRSEYDEHQAMSIISHVKELMQHIAKGK